MVFRDQKEGKYLISSHNKMLNVNYLIFKEILYILYDYKSKNLCDHWHFHATGTISPCILVTQLTGRQTDKLIETFRAC